MKNGSYFPNYDTLIRTPLVQENLRFKIFYSLLYRLRTENFNQISAQKRILIKKNKKCSEQLPMIPDSGQCFHFVLPENLWFHCVLRGYKIENWQGLSFNGILTIARTRFSHFILPQNTPVVKEKIDVGKWIFNTLFMCDYSQS